MSLSEVIKRSLLLLGVLLLLPSSGYCTVTSTPKIVEVSMTDWTTLRENNSKQQAILNQLNQKLQMADKALTESNQSLKIAQTKLTTSTTANSQLQTQLATANSQLMQSQQQTLQLKNNLLEQKQEIAQLQEQLATLQNLSNSASNSINQANQSLKDMRQDLIKENNRTKNRLKRQRTLWEIVAIGAAGYAAYNK